MSMIGLCLSMLLLIYKGQQLIVNGDFQLPKRGQQVSYFKNGDFPGWSSNGYIECSAEFRYLNNNVAQNRVLQLDSNENIRIKQNIELDFAYRVQLNFDIAPRYNCQQSSTVGITWNNESLRNLTFSENEKKHIRINLPGIKGTNVLSFQGLGRSDTVGGIIDNVSMVILTTQLVVNGGFQLHQGNQSGSFKYKSGQLNGWRINGQVFGNDTGGNKVVQLAKNNTKIQQSFDLQKNYRLQLNYDSAPRIHSMNDLKNISLRIKWNGKIIKQQKFQKQGKIHTKLFLQGIKGTNTITFQGTGQGDGIGEIIDNVSLTIIGYQLIVNGQFQLPQRRAFGLLENGDFIGWNSTGPIERGIESHLVGNENRYNRVIQLDSNQNMKLYQKVSLDQAQQLQLNFDCAARSQHKESSPIRVRWNDAILLDMTFQRYQFYHLKISIRGIKGENTISFEARGKSDGYGGVIDNVSVFKAFKTSNYLPLRVMMINKKA